jgi:excisionase family DNA binding protein
MNLLKVTAVAERLDCSVSFVYQVIASGELPHYRLGRGQGGIRVSVAQIAEFLGRRQKGGRVEPAAPAVRKKVKLRHLDV